MPLAVRPVEVEAPEEVHGTGANGSEQIEVTAGFNGTLGTRVAGLLGTTPRPDSVATGQFDRTRRRRVRRPTVARSPSQDEGRQVPRAGVAAR